MSSTFATRNMAAQKPRPEEVEDYVLRNIFLVTLRAREKEDSRMFYLEYSARRKGSVKALSRDLMDDLIYDRLKVASRSRSDCETPIDYLVNSYRRAKDEEEKIPSFTNDKTLRTHMESVVKDAKMLVISFLSASIFKGGQEFSEFMALIFRDVSLSMDEYGVVSSSSSGGLMPPPGLIDYFFVNVHPEYGECIFHLLYNACRDNVVTVSALGNFQQPLRALLLLIEYQDGAVVFANHLIGTMKNVDGRNLEMSSLLGALLHVSALPDHDHFKSSPNVGEQCFSKSSTRPSTDFLSTFSAVKCAMNNLYDGLTKVLQLLLNNTTIHESVLEYLGNLINRNASRGNVQVVQLSSSSSGMLVNLSAVMLRLFEPFLNPNLTIRDKIDPKYVANNRHLNLRDLTTLNASCGVSDWTSRVCNGGNQMPHSQPETPKYPLFCDYFFMTARVLNLGLVKAFSDFKCLDQYISSSKDSLAVGKAMQANQPSERLQLYLALHEMHIELRTQDKCCYEAQIIRDGGFIRLALSFYRLMVVWLVGLIGGFKIPLPSSIPVEFAAMPEHFVEDTVDILILAARNPEALDGEYLDDFVNFVIMFVASPEYIKNLSLRAKMVEVLCWMLHRSGLSRSTLFGEPQLPLKDLVKILLKVYVGMDLTGSHTQFYDKSNIRHNIAELLKFLRQDPIHEKMWAQISKEEDGVYLESLNILIKAP